VALIDGSWLTGLQQAAGVIGSILAGAAAGALVMWRNFSKTRNAAGKEEGELSWIRDMREDMRRGDLELGEARAEIRALNVTIGDLRAECGGLHAQVGAYQERLRESQERLADLAAGRERIAGQCEERVRALSEQLLDQRMANGRLFLALSTADKPAAEKLLTEHLRPFQVVDKTSETP
jgi:septal ring factor EnvC (AmiA/AmiB activator)